MNETDFGSILDEEEVVVDVRRPIGGVVSVRFNGDEMRVLRSEVNRTNERISSFIKEAVFAHIALRRHERGPGVQMAMDGSLHGYVARGISTGFPTLANTGEVKGWPGRALSEQLPPRVR